MGQDVKHTWTLQSRQRGVANYTLVNLSLGVSVEDQKTAAERIPILLRTPAAKRFVSYEPALGPVNFSPCLPIITIGGVEIERWIDWVIVGGESGHGARPFNIEWARSVVRECREAGVACFVKQMGTNCFVDQSGSKPVRLRLRNRNGADPAEWPEDLRVQEFPK